MLTHEARSKRSELCLAFAFLEQKIAVSSVAIMNGGKMIHGGNSGISGEGVGVGVGVVGSGLGDGEGVGGG